MSAVADKWELFFSSLGVRTLPSVLEAGDIALVVDRSEIEQYCAVAAAAWTEGLPTATQEARDEMNGLYGRLVYAIVAGEGEIYREIDGEPYVVFPDGDVVEVTPEKIRHWEWLRQIFHDGTMARRLLREAPGGIGPTAINRVMFNSIVLGET